MNSEVTQRTATDEPTPEALLEVAIAAARAGGAVLERHFRDPDLEISLKGTKDFVTRADHESEAAIFSVLRESFPDHDLLAEESGEVAAPRSASDLESVSASGARRETYEWVIDPLDGTTNFLRGLPVWSVSIACRRGDELLAAVVFDPPGTNLFSAARGAGAHWNGSPMSVSRQRGLEGSFLATGYPFRAHRALDLYLAAFRDIFLDAQAIRRCGSAALDLAYTAAGVYDGFFEFRLSAWDIAAGWLLIEEAGGVVTDLAGDPRGLAGGNVIAGGAAVHRELLAAVTHHTDEAELARRFAEDALG